MEREVLEPARVGSNRARVPTKFRGPARPSATRGASGLCRTDALEDELLGTLARVDFSRVDVALGVYRQVMHPVELSCLTSMAAELPDDLAVVAQCVQMWLFSPSAL